MSPWVKLAIAILVEVAATMALRQSNGFTSIPWTVTTIVGYVISFYVVAQITNELPIGTIYAIWSGTGTALVAAIGIIALNEEISALRIGGVALIILGVVALNLGSSGESESVGAAGTPAAPTA